MAQAEVEEPEEAMPSRRGKRKGLDARIPKDLPTETLMIEPEEVKANPQEWKKIGEERTEQLDVTPARFFRTIIISPKHKKLGDRSVAPWFKIGGRRSRPDQRRHLQPHRDLPETRDQPVQLPARNPQCPADHAAGRSRRLDTRPLEINPRNAECIALSRGTQKDAYN